MKTFISNSFFLLFEEVLRKDRPKDADTWSAAGASWRHARHTFSGQGYGFTTEIYEITSAAKGGWSLIVVKDHWWAGRHGDAVRTAHWAKPLRGSRKAIIAWFNERQRELEGLR